MGSVPRDDNFIPGIIVLGSATGADVIVEGNEDTKGMNVHIVGDDVGLPTGVNVYNIDLTVINTEYSQALPSGTNAFTFQNRASNDLRFAFVTGKVATPTAPYMTLKAGQNYFEEGLNLTSKTIYLASANAGDDVEIITWS